MEFYLDEIEAPARPHFLAARRVIVRTDPDDRGLPSFPFSPKRCLRRAIRKSASAPKTQLSQS
jgi:hypothetical protein